MATITLLYADGFRASKQHRRGSSGEIVTEDYERRTWFSFAPRDAGDIRELSALLTNLEGQGDTFVILGVPKEGIEPGSEVRRLLYKDTENGQGPYFKEADDGQPWLVLDIDRLPCPPDLDPVNEPENAVVYALSRLPDEFASATCHWQLSASAGVDSGGLIKMHLWFWLDRPVKVHSLRQWARVVNDRAGLQLIDPAPFNPVQPIYTAAPVFLDHLTDPVAQRSGLREGHLETVAIDLPRQEELHSSSVQQVPSAYHGHELEYWLTRIGDHQGGHGFHEPCLHAAMSYVQHGGRNPSHLKQKLQEAILGADATNHSQSEIQDRAGDQHLDSLIQWAFERFETQGPHFASDPLSVEEATAKLQETIQDFGDGVFGNMGRHGFELLHSSVPHIGLRRGIRAAAGLGKTSAVEAMLLRHIDKVRRSTIEFYVPTHELADEIAGRLDEQDVPVTVIRGRDRTGDDDHPLCRKNKAAGRMSAAGVNVRKNLCGIDSPPSERCEHFEGCPYLAQFQNLQSGVRVMAHNYLFLNRVQELDEPDFIIIDEAFHDKASQEREFPLSELLAEVNGEDIEHRALKRELHDMLSSGAPLLSALLQLGIDEARLNAARNDENRTQGRSSAIAQRRGLTGDAALPDYKIALLFDRLAKEIGFEREQCHAVWVREGKVHLGWREDLRLGEHTIMLVLDADLDETIMQRILERGEIIRIEVERNAEVIQVRNRTVGNYWLSGDGDPELGQQRLSELKRLIGREVERHPDKVLVVSPKKVRRAITEDEGDLKHPTDHEGATYIHFHKLRGVDSFKDYETVIIIGRHQPPDYAIEDAGRALWWDDPLPLRLDQQLKKEDRGYRMRSGENASAKVMVHPDNRIQRGLELKRECETLQAIDRLRLVHNENPKKVIVVSNIVLDLTVDRLVTWDELMEVPPRILLAWRRSGGVLPLKPSYLHEKFSDIWSSERNARNDVQGHSKRQELLTNIIRENGVLLFRYRTNPRGGNWSHALLDTNISDPRLALEEALSCPVAAFEVDEG